MASNPRARRPHSWPALSQPAIGSGVHPSARRSQTKSLSLRSEQIMTKPRSCTVTRGWVGHPGAQRQWDCAYEGILALVEAERDDRYLQCPCYVTQVVYTSRHRLVCMGCGHLHCVLEGPVAAKRRLYADSKILLTRDVAERAEWNRQAIEHRRAALAKLAVQAWRFQ